jgi:hypothetical protein
MDIKNLIGISEEMIENSKLHFAIGPKNKYEPLDAFFRNEFDKWQEDQSLKNFEKEYILSSYLLWKDEVVVCRSLQKTWCRIY